MKGAEPPTASLARGPALIVAAIAALAFIVLAGVLVPWDWVPGGDLKPAKAADIFTPAEIARAEEYSAARRWLSWSSYFLSLVIALMLGFTSWGSKLVRRIGRRLPWLLLVPVAVLVLLFLGRLVTMPFSIALHRLGLEYGLTNQDWGAWSVDYLKSFLVVVVLMSLISLVVVGAARWSPRYWFAWAGGAAALTTVGASFLYPVVVEPLFNEFTPMRPGPFKQSVFELAGREGLEIDDVLVSDASRRTTTLNAYVSGFGGTRRVVVYDNLLSELTPDEARIVIAHELAHAKYDDVLVGTALGAVGIIVGVSLLAVVLDTEFVHRRSGVRMPSDAAVVPVVLALIAIGGFLANPAQNTISRAIEARADRVSIRSTGESKVFIDMQRELAVHSLNDPTPHSLSQFWFGSHPTVLQRIGISRSIEEDQ